MSKSDADNGADPIVDEAGPAVCPDSLAHLPSLMPSGFPENLSTMEIPLDPFTNTGVQG